MPNIRKLTEEKETEEEIQKVQKEKRNKKEHKRRKLIGPYDLPVDRHLPKIYIDPADIGEPVHVKVEIKTESLENENDHAATVGESEDLQQNEEIEDSVLFFVEDEAFIQKDLTSDKVLPLVLPILERKDILNCREVNKQWRKMVDDFIENSIVSRPYNDKVYQEKITKSPKQLVPLPNFKNIKHAYTFGTETDFEKFNETMQGHMESGSGPFVGGATIVLKNLSIGLPELSQPTTMFLENFGVHIHRLELQQKQIKLQEDVDIVGFVNCVKRCLSYVPNLEQLKIIGNCLHKDSESRLSGALINLYRSEIMDRTPKLDKLTSMDFDYVEREEIKGIHCIKMYIKPYIRYLEDIFGDIMINPYYKRQLKQLSLHRDISLLNLKLENVNELTLIDGRWCSDKIDCQLSVEKLTLLKCCSWRHDLDKIFPRLKYLCVDYYNWKCLSTCSSYNARNAAARDSLRNEMNIHTLEVVHFDIQYEDLSRLNNSFPHLRHLIVRQPENACKRFSVEDLNRNQLNKLFFGGTTYCTSLWESLPSLDIFTFQFQNHVELMKKPEYFGFCKCFARQKTKCLYKNIVETRQGYRTYKERNISKTAK